MTGRSTGRKGFVPNEREAEKLKGMSLSSMSGSNVDPMVLQRLMAAERALGKSLFVRIAELSQQERISIKESCSRIQAECGRQISYQAVNLLISLALNVGCDKDRHAFDILDLPDLPVSALKGFRNAFMFSTIRNLRRAENEVLGGVPLLSYIAREHHSFNRSVYSLSYELGIPTRVITALMACIGVPVRSTKERTEMLRKEKEAASD